MKKKLLAGIAASCLFVTLWFPGVTFADELEEKKEGIKKRDREIQQIEKEKKLTEKEKQSVMEDLDRMKEKLSRLNQEVFQTERKLTKHERRLADKERQIRERKALFNNRIRTLYRQGEMFYLESLLHAQSFDDFLNRLEMIRLISQHDRNLIEGYEKDRREIAREKREIESLLKEQKKKAEEAKELHETLTARYKKYQSQLTSLEAKQKELEETNEEEKARIRELIRKRLQEEKEKQYKKKGESSGEAFYWPVKGASVTSGYGMRYHPVTGKYKMHTGIDLSAPLGTPIHAAEAGEVIESRPATGYGHIIIISHGGGLATLYAHMYPQDVTVQVGQKVSRGQMIARVGNNGWSTGPHLHFEVHKNGNHTDPMPYFK